MKPAVEKIISALNKLVETCKDGQNGYRAAGAKAQDKELKRLCRKYASQRARFAAELQEEVHRHGAHPERGGTFGGAVHRGWLNLKAALLGATDAALIAECERGDEAALRNYEAVTGEVLPADLAALIGTQYAEIKKAHERIKALLPPPAEPEPAPPVKAPRTSARRSPRSGESPAPSAAPSKKAPPPPA